MRLIRLVLGLVAAVGVLVLAPSPAYACSCAAGSVREYVEGAELVVRGTVEGRDEGMVPGGEVVYSVAVEEVYVGEAGPVAQIHTGGDGDSCGLEVEVGRAYVVVAHASGGEYHAGLCGGTSAVAPGLVADVEAVTGPGAAPDPSLRTSEDDLATFTVVAAALAATLAVVLAWRFRRG